MPRAERKASLRVAHSRSCPNVNLTALSSVGTGSGCTCRPRYYTFHRGNDVKPIKGDRVLDRRVADRALRKLQTDLDEGRAAVYRPDTRTFEQWADDYLSILAVNGRKASTERSYSPTIRFAKSAFGATPLRDVGAPHLRRFVEAIRANDSGDATVAKHLRQLGAIFSAAVDEGILVANPIPRYRRQLKLRIPKGDEAFTDGELHALWAAIRDLKADPVYLALCRAAVTTGARQGELIAAKWDDLDLTNKTLRLRYTYDSTERTLTLPKDNEERTVNLIPPAVRVFEQWIAENGYGDDGTPIFPAPRSSSFLNGVYVTKRVRRAMVKAGIPEVAPNGRRRKPFHAFRACYARLCRELGRDQQWVQGQLGHSSPELTLNVYGRWSEDAKRAEAERVPADAFPV